MNFLVISLLITFITCAGVLAYWYWEVIPNHNALNSEYTRFSQFKGSDRIVDEFGGELGNENFHTREVIEKSFETDDDKILKINVDITSRHRDTGEIVFHAIDEYVIDRFTKKHVSDTELYFAFPKKVEKKSYEFLHPIIHRPTTLDFIKVTEIQGIEAYVFECEPKVNDNTLSFEQFDGKKIHVNYTCMMYVEPTTGYLLSMELNWHNFFVNDDGTPISDTQIGGVSSTDFFTNEQILLVKKDLDMDFHVNNVFPIIILLFFGLVSVIQYIIVIVYSEKNKRITEQLNTEKTKNEFIQIFSHELKTPLVSIRGYCEILMQENNLDKIKEKKFLKKIYSESDNLLEMIKKMVFIHKIYNNIFEIENKQIFLDEFLEDIHKSFQNLVKQKNAKMVIEQPELKSFKGDQYLLRHVFENLINNALDFIPDQKGEIKIDVQSFPNKIIFTISNNGPQIPSKYLNKIFTKYYQVDKSLSRTYSGSSGLGLSICKKIVEMHKGEIYAWNDKKGTNFTFWIPI